MNNVRNLSFIGICMAFVVIALGAWTRLVDAGLGCPDWPGCYGFVWMPTTEAEISQANTLYPEREFEVEKAIPEVVHRYFAGSLGLLIIAIFAMSFFLKPRNELVTKLSGALTLLVLFQSTFGYLTVSLKLWPQIVSIHLLGGFATTTLIFLIYVKLKELSEGNKNLYSMTASSKNILNWAFPVLIIQIILGVWLSSNYASLACPDFPLCQGEIIPNADFKMGFNFLQSIGPDYLGGQLDHEARLAIHIVHRFGAYFVTAYFLFLTFILAKERQFGFAKILISLLFLQLILGVSNIIYSLPLYVAIAHNLGALLLLISISYFRLKVSDS